LIIIHLFFSFFVSLYSDSSWKAIPDSQSFLFTLVNPSGNQPIKITPNPSAGAGIHCESYSGPSFGHGSTSSDLRVCLLTRKDGGVSYVSYLSVGHGFTYPKNVNNNTYFTDENPSKVSELEVFKVNL